MNIHIREMAVTDIPAIHEMARNEPGFKVAPSKTSCFWSEEQLRKWIVAGEDVLLVAEADGEIAGFVLTTIHKPTGKATWENQFTSPTFRKSGVAAALEHELFKQLRARGVTYVTFLVREDNTNMPHYDNLRFERGHTFLWFGKHL